ncbi:MAG: insulinase family protein [Sphingobacteriaceae bacterium]|nr:insulinase family protein [Sphingobacteriaceae bacterium]
MDNGLNLIIHEDHSDPVVYVDVTYHVGSSREQQGRSGFAHFFEHMMFQGSKNVGDDQHFKIVSEAGGNMNGTTNTDRTNYFQVVPSNYLETMLWLESDRMGFLLDSVTQKKFEIQRATVKNERGQRYDNAPYGLEREKIGEALYPQGHPYSWLTIGYIDDLNRVDVNDLKRFYMRWYGPNNAALTISGDVNTDEVLLLVQKYFGSIERGPAVSPMKVAPVKLTANRFISYEDNIKFPMVTLVFPTVKDGEKDDVALSILGDILSGHESSPLRKAFINSKKASAAYAFQMSRELAGQFQISVRANPGTSLSATYAEIKTALDTWEKSGISDEDLLKFKAQYKSHLYDRLQTVQGKGATLASNFVLMGDANDIKKQIKLFETVTKEDIKRVYNTYIKNKACVISSFVPKGQSNLKAGPDNWKMYERKIEAESAEYKNLSYQAPVEDFDRSKKPTAGPAHHARIPSFYTATLVNNIPLIGVVENEIPKIDIVVSFKAGHDYESLDKAGIAGLTAAMLMKSTLKTSVSDFEDKLDLLGANVHIHAGAEEFQMSITSPKENISAVIKLAEEALLQPKFDPSEFELVKKQLLDRISQSKSNASQIANLALDELLYGKTNRKGLPANGTTETVQSITIDDIKNYYNQLNASMLSVAVSGDITKEEAIKNLEFIKKVKTGNPIVLSPQNVPAIEKTKIYFIEKKNAPQSEIRMAYVALPYDCCGEYFKANVMNFSFSGAFNSRVNYLLREIKGWTYGTRGAFHGGRTDGNYVISGGFKGNATDSTLIELFREIKNYADNGITESELEFTRHAIAQSDALRYESSLQKLYFVKRIMDYGLSADYVKDQVKVLDALTVNDVNQIAKKYLPYNNMIVLVVGDKTQNLEKIKQLGYEVIEIQNESKKD